MDEEAKREIKDQLISFDRSLIASGMSWLVWLIIRSSSYRAQEVWWSICSCSLPEVLPIKVQPVSGCHLFVSVILMSTPYSCLFADALEERNSSTRHRVHITQITVRVRNPISLGNALHTPRRCVHTCYKSSSRWSLHHMHPPLLLFL